MSVKLWRREESWRSVRVMGRWKVATRGLGVSGEDGAGAGGEEGTVCLWSLFGGEDLFLI